jgi:hypothetical protein
MTFDKAAFRKLYDRYDHKPVDLKWYVDGNVSSAREGTLSFVVRGKRVYFYYGGTPLSFYYGSYRYLTFGDQVMLQSTSSGGLIGTDNGIYELTFREVQNDL